MVTVEFLKRVPVNGYWIMPGSRAEFATAGQAGVFTRGDLAKIVPSKVPAPSRKRAKKAKENDTLDAGKKEQPGPAAGDD